MGGTAVWICHPGLTSNFSFNSQFPHPHCRSALRIMADGSPQKCRPCRRPPHKSKFGLPTKRFEPFLYLDRVRVPGKSTCRRDPRAVSAIVHLWWLLIRRSKIPSGGGGVSMFVYIWDN